MSDIRFEEYEHMGDGLPFVYMGELYRTKQNCSSEANWHENIELQLCIEGEGTVLIDGERHSFSPGDLVVVNSGAIHHTGTETKLVYTCMIFDPVFCRRAGLEPSALYFASRFRDDVCLSLYREMECVYRAINDPYRCARLQLLTLQLLILLAEHHSNPLPSRTRNVPTHETVKRAIRYIRDNYNKKLTLDEIAGYVYADKYGLTRIFKQLTKQTVISYINHYRCQKAMTMIESGMSVSEAANQCGFHNMSFFTRTFRQYTGKLPSACRSGK